MAQTAEQVSDYISTQYSTLEQRYIEMAEKEGIALSFEQLCAQLQWAANPTELARAVHRLHCVVDIYQQPEGHEDIYNILHLPTPIQRSALIALIMLDASKASKEAAAAYKAYSDVEPLRDSVASLIDMLEHYPQFSPLFQALGDEAQAYVRDHIFYIHFRHLQLGEVPPSSLTEFQSIISRGAEHASPRLALMAAFWLSNLLGFEGISADQLGETQSHTATPERIAGFHQVHAALKACVASQNLQPMHDYYVLPENLISSNETLSVEAKSLLGRLYLLVKDRHGESEAPIAFSEILKAPELMNAIQHLALLEQRVYLGQELQALTFLPAVYWTLDDIMKDAAISDKLSMFVQFQLRFLQAVPSFRSVLGRDRCIPLFSIKDNQDSFLQRFIIQDPQGFSFKLSLTGPFLTVTGILAPKAVAVSGATAAQFLPLPGSSDDGYQPEEVFFRP